MGLTTKAIQRSAVDVAQLSAALSAAGFAFSGLHVECGVQPVVRLTIDDVNPDPTDFINGYVDPGAIKVTSNKAIVDGSPEALADGVDKHVLTLKKVWFNTDTQAPGGEQLKVVPSSMIAVTPSRPTLVDGVITVEIGPSTLPGELIVKVADVAGKMFGGFLKVRFA